MQAYEIVDGPGLGSKILVAVCAYHRIAGLGRLVLYAVENGCIVVGDEVGHDHAYNPRRLTPQASCKWIGTIIEPLGQVLDPLLHLLAYLWTAAQGAAHGGNAHPKLLGKVFE